MERLAEVTMQIKQAMTRGVEVVRPGDTLQQAARKMKSLDVGALPVCDGDRLVGMITDRDIIVRATAEGRDPRTTPAKEAMTPEVVYVFEDQDIEQAASVMKERQLRRLAVLDRNKRLVGILSLGDVAEETDDEELSGEVLERVSEPSRPARGPRRNA
jgi:CBS domain-containing protein